MKPGKSWLGTGCVHSVQVIFPQYLHSQRQFVHDLSTFGKHTVGTLCMILGIHKVKKIFKNFPEVSNENHLFGSAYLQNASWTCHQYHKRHVCFFAKIHLCFHQGGLSYDRASFILHPPISACLAFLSSFSILNVLCILSVLITPVVITSPSPCSVLLKQS